MRQRTCAALVLCGPLVAGCGAVTRVDFAAHSRPAPPLEVSVLSARDSGLVLDPSRFRAGLVLFNISNQTAHAERYSYRVHGRSLTQTPMIAPGQSAQLKVMLSGAGGTLDSFSRASARSTLAGSVELQVSGRARTGDDEVAQT